LAALQLPASSTLISLVGDRVYQSFPLHDLEHLGDIRPAGFGIDVIFAEKRRANLVDRGGPLKLPPDVRCNLFHAEAPAVAHVQRNYVIADIGVQSCRRPAIIYANHSLLLAIALEE
jgi:hypothetical protein